MKIVILDGFTLNPGDLSWDEIKNLGEVIVHDRTPSELVLERSIDAEILLTNKTRINAETLSNLPRLRYIGVLATGYNIIDIGEAKKRNIVVTNIPSYSTYSVAQMTFALILEHCFHVQRHSDSVMNGKWEESVDFSYWDYPLIELFGKTIGIIGFGNIGNRVADIAIALGMNILATSRTKTEQLDRKNFQWSNLEELLANSDFVSIHLPLTAETTGLINKNNIKLMKKSAFLINTSRGKIINENDLAEALNKELISGAGLDVLSIEPPTCNNPLLKAKNCLITPHISWATKEARKRLMSIAATNIKSYLNGEIINIVNS